jgi:DNA-binding transcriptional ArsR family regulator
MAASISTRPPRRPRDLLPPGVAAGSLLAAIYNPMVVDQQTDTEVDRLFHALADTTRRDIVRRVLTAEHSVSELARGYPISLTAVQKHVTVLAEAGLVTKRRHGREQRVAGEPAGLRRARVLLDAYEQLWRDRMARITDVLADEPADKPRGGTP